MVEQVSFIAGARSLNEQDLRKKLKFFQVPEASIESIRSKLNMRIFDEYTNNLRCMYSTRFNGCTARSESGTSTEAHPTPETTTSSLISKALQRSVFSLTGSSLWRVPVVPVLATGVAQRLLDTDQRSTRKTDGEKELPTTHCSWSFLTSMRIVYCRINKLSTDNSSETLTQGL